MVSGTQIDIHTILRHKFRNILVSPADDWHRICLVVRELIGPQYFNTGLYTTQNKYVLILHAKSIRKSSAKVGPLLVNNLVVCTSPQLIRPINSALIGLTKLGLFSARLHHLADAQPEDERSRMQAPSYF